MKELELKKIIELQTSLIELYQLRVNHLIGKPNKKLISYFTILKRSSNIKRKLKIIQKAD